MADSKFNKLAQWACIAVVIPTYVGAFFTVFPPSPNPQTNVHYASVMQLSPIVRISFLTALVLFLVAGVLAGVSLFRNWLRPPLAPIAEDSHEAARVDFDWNPDWKSLVYKNSPGRWREVDSSERVAANTALVVNITRQLPQERESHSDATVKAILRIKGNSGTPVQITNPYWIGVTEYQDEFDIGHTSTIVVGCLEDSLLACYQNIHASPPYSSGWAVPKREIGTRTTVPASGTLTVEITLFDVHKKMVLKKISFDVILTCPLSLTH